MEEEAQIPEHARLSELGLVGIGGRERGGTRIILLAYIWNARREVE